MQTEKTTENKKDFTPLSSLSWEEASEVLSFPKPNTDGFYEQLIERDKGLANQKVAEG